MTMYFGICSIFRYIICKTPHHKGEALLRQDLSFHLHPAGQPEHDPVLGIHCHTVDQRGPQTLVELGDELRQVLRGLDEAFDLPSPDHDLVDLLDDRIALSFGILIPADQRVVALIIFLLVLRYPGVAGNQVVHRLGVDAQLLIQNPALLLQLRGVGQPVLYGGELRDVEFAVRVQLVHHPDERGLDLIFGQVRCLAAGFVFELVVTLPNDPAVLIVAVPDL